MSNRTSNRTTTRSNRSRTRTDADPRTSSPATAARRGTRAAQNHERVELPRDIAESAHRTIMRNLAVLEMVQAISDLCDGADDDQLLNAARAIFSGLSVSLECISDDTTSDLFWCLREALEHNGSAMSGGQGGGK